MRKMRIILAGKGERAMACFRAMRRDGFDVVEVISKDPALTSAAREDSISVFATDDINSAASIEHIKQLDCDVIVLASFTQIIKKPLLSVPSFGLINLHGGKLPEYRGSSTLNWMIINGEKEGGISIIKVDRGIDTGPILSQERFSILDTDTIATILEKTFVLFPKMLLDVLHKIENKTLVGTPQTIEEGAYYHSRKPEDGRILWREMSDENVFNMVRALVDPLPGAFTYLHSKKILITKAAIIREEIKGIPGRVARKTKDGVVVVAKNRGILVTEIARKRKVMPSREVFKVGDTLE